MVISEIYSGGKFLISEGTDFFIPEEATEDQKMLKEVAKGFVDQYILPHQKEIEKQQGDISARYLEKIGELGLLSTHMPTKYGGLELDTNTNTVISMALGNMGSFNTTMAAHSGIGMLPILYYGSEELKQKYLPKLMTGESKAAYCLTEPSSGSDALSAKTIANLTKDGKHYEISGQKMWISNAGFANVMIVFAKVDGDKFTGFVLDAPAEGLTLGEEEDKMGIKGSSTRQVFFDKVKVPVENVLGEIGKGHLIAFNALNTGRFKLGLLTVGGSKHIVDMAVKYANERHQFKRAISSFGAIQYKLAEMTIRILACESAVFRTSDLMNIYAENKKEEGIEYGEAKRLAAEEYAIESSILKVAGSEISEYAVDENVQIHGGLGFSEEMDAARAYRDNRITRIYEGTNEINRLLIVEMLLKRAKKGRLDLTGPAWDVQKELKKMPSFDMPSGPLSKEIKAVESMKKMILMVAGGAVKEQMDGNLNLENEQMLITFISDMLIDLYLAESFLIRTKKLVNQQHDTAKLMIDALKVFVNDVQDRLAKNAKDAISGYANGDVQKIFMMGIKRFSNYPPQNVIQLRRNIAMEIISQNKYPFVY